jgi:predicted  nucleic acid-binding Zn-ribbon protein
MRIRHRVPSTFSISMLDILACGLGAMLLLLLVNFWDSRSLRERSAAYQANLTEATAELTRLRSALTDRDADMESLRKDRGQLAVRLDEQTQALQSAGATLAELRTKLAATQALLDQARKEQQATEKLLASARLDSSTLRKDLTKSTVRLSDLEQQLRSMETAKSLATKAASAVPRLVEELDAAKARVAALESDVVQLRKQLEEAGIKLAAAEKEQSLRDVDAATLRKLLAEQQATSGRLRQELQVAVNRFAGIEMMGKRVILLVDTSGSMGYVDERTPAPEKWPALARTVAQVLRSLPDIERYQVVLFSDDARFLMGAENSWLEFDRTKSPGEVEAALLKFKPSGNTHMHAAFEAAFRYRDQGLDTIFLFSDGLPNIGPPLPRDAPKDEAGQSALYGNMIRDALRGRWNRPPNPVRINAVGFYYESPNLGAFLWALSRENGGSFVGMSRP